METKRLFRSATNRKIAGVCGGLGEYFNTDSVFFRLLFCCLFFAGGFGLIAYLIMALIIPGNSPYKITEDTAKSEVQEEVKNDKNKNLTVIFGALFITLGIAIFLNRIFPYYDYEFIFPSLLVFGGVLLVIFSKNK